MTVRLPLSTPIVVTGPAGSGKSKLAKAIARRADCDHINVGDVLRDQLLAAGITVNHRRDIGPVFLDRFKLDGYVRLVHKLLLRPSPAVIDGVRIATALAEARRREIDFFHVMRSGNPGWNMAPTEPWAREVDALKETIDYVVDWASETAHLDRTADAIVVEVRMRRYAGPVWDSPTEEMGTLSPAR